MSSAMQSEAKDARWSLRPRVGVNSAGTNRRVGERHRRVLRVDGGWTAW